MLFGETIAVYFESHKKYKNTNMVKMHMSILVIKHVVHIVTTMVKNFGI
jgi:hypothetical protein